MQKNKIKWAAIQPLTGSFYIGARNAIGHDAEFILSYHGNNDYKCDDYLIVGDKSEVPFLVKRGIDKKKIKPLGIPIAPITDNNFKKETLLKKLNISSLLAK